MATNLKKSKKIRAFCYRMVAVGALITAIATAFMGREALVDAYKYGPEVFSGSIYHLPEFREYISKLYQEAMIGYAGVGDNNGYPLTEGYANMVSEDMRDEFEKAVRRLGDDVLYYVHASKSTGAQGQKAFTNVKYPIFSEYDGHLLLPEDMILCCYWDGESGVLQFFEDTGDTVNAHDFTDLYYDAQYSPNKSGAGNIKLVLAVKADCSVEELEVMECKAAGYRTVAIVLLVSLGIWLIFALLVLCTGRAGRRAKEEFGQWSAKVLLEVKLVLVAVAVLVIYSCRLYTFAYDISVRMNAYDKLWVYFPLGCMLYLFSVDIRHNGGGIFLNSLPVRGVCSAVRILRGRSWYRRAWLLHIGNLISGVVLTGGGAYLILARNSVPYYLRSALDRLMFWGIVMAVTGIWLLFSYVIQTGLLKDMAGIVAKISEVVNGGTGDSIKLSRYSGLAGAAEDLEKLENGIERAVEQQNRSNRMRVELLTNVSHDLKTPLTSIINYADLLCEEELPEAAAGYATALQGKAYRLKNMVQDVFDLSKATSGNLHVENTAIDLVKLIQQTLADMDERIQESGLIFKLNISAQPLMIEADGEKLYRVFQNLFVNALQYSLENSRVHIQLSEEGGFAVAKVKNTSRMELNFEASEIVERFVRADSSRTTEGSGLGLSIVQSFVETCGGQFKVETDADMFSACVSFPLLQTLSTVETDEEPAEEVEEVY